MIHLCLAYTAYRTHRGLPGSHQARLQGTVFVLGLGAVGLQVFVLLRPQSSRYCSQALLTNLVGSIVLTFFAVSLTVLLTQLEPVPAALKVLLSVFAVGSFGEGVCTVVLTVLATDCEKTTPELYSLSVLLSVSSLMSTGGPHSADPSAALFSGLGLLWLCRVTRPRPGTKPAV